MVLSIPEQVSSAQRTEGYYCRMCLLQTHVRKRRVCVGLASDRIGERGLSGVRLDFLLCFLHCRNCCL